MSESDETEYSVRNYAAIDNQVAQMAAREAEETRRLRYLNFFRLAQIFAVSCLALGILMVLAGWGIKLARSYNQEIIHKGSHLEKQNGSVQSLFYDDSGYSDSSFGQIKISETEKKLVANTLNNPDASNQIEEIFDDQNNVANRIDNLEEENRVLISKMEGELALSPEAIEKLRQISAEDREIPRLEDDIQEGMDKLSELEETTANNIDLKKNSADSFNLSPEQSEAIRELNETQPALANKVQSAADSLPVGNDIARQLENHNKNLSDAGSNELTDGQSKAVDRIAQTDPALAKEVSDALKASNAIDQELLAAEEQNQKIREEQGLAPKVTPPELAEVREALQTNPELATKIEDALTKPNALSQQALAEENENLRGQLSAAGQKNREVAEQLADARESNQLMERNFETGFTEVEKEALADVVQANPSLKNKLGAALDPQLGSVQDYANRAARAQQEAQRAAGEAAAAEKRAQGAEAELEAMNETFTAASNAGGKPSPLSEEEEQMLEPIFEANPELEEKIKSAINTPSIAPGALEAQVKAATEEAQQAEGRAGSAVKRAEQAEEALKRAEDALDQSLGEKNDEEMPNFDRGFSEREKAALEPVLVNNPELKEKLARALQPEQGSTQDFANKLAEAEAAAQKAQFQAQDAQNRADQAEKDLIETNSDNSIELEEQLTEAKLKLSKANEKLGIALSKLERLENQRSDSLIPASMDELLKELSPEEIAELETLMAKSPDLLEALKRQAAEEARRSMNIKENVKFQNQEISSGIPGYTITTWFEFENSTDVETASRVCSLARPNERGGGVDSFPIAKQSGSDREVRTAGLTADLTDRSITEDQLRLALPKCVWRKD